jgi:hypothetical protein
MNYLINFSIKAGMLCLLLLSFSNRAEVIQAQAKPATASPKTQKTTSNYRFASGKSALRIPFDLSNNIILVRARLNNSQPLWFIFDTGASSSIINARLVKELGLRVQGKENGIATGGSIEVELIPGVSFALPGVKVFNQTVASLPLDDLSTVAGRAISGIIGYDFIKQFVVELDYGAKTINLYAPASYKYSGSGDTLPIKFINGKPFVSASFTPEGRRAITGTFLIDTGADGALNLNSPFVRAHQLLDSTSKVKQANLGGMGGTSRSITTRAQKIQFGRFAISSPLVSFSQATEGSEALADYDGVLGGEIFRRFKLILDYSRRRIIFEPNAHLPEPVEEDMSGIEITADGADFKTFVIGEVAANSPAAAAGLQEDDELTAINNRPVSEFSLDQIRQMFRQEGKEYLLRVKRGEKALQVKIKLKRLI